MQPQVTPQPQAAPQPDLQVLALTKAIRQQESGGNYQAVGDNSTSTGAYQFQPATWKNYAQQVLGDPNAQMTDSNQNAVAYGMIKSWKDQGLGPAEIAAKWNSGSAQGWENKVGTTTAGGQPLDYNVPAYVQGVVNNFKQIYPTVQSQFNPAPQVPGVATAEASTGAPTISPQHTDALNSLTHFFNAIFPGKQVGDAIGTLAGYGLAKANGTADQYDLSAPSPLAVAGDIGQGALAIGAGMPEGTALSAFGKVAPSVLPEATSVLGRIGSTALTGAGFGLTGALASGKTNVGDIAKQTGLSAIIGGGLGTTGELVSAALDRLPPSVAQMALKLSPKTLETKPGVLNQALEDLPFGLKSSMAKASQNAMNIYNENIDGILATPEYSHITFSGPETLNVVKDQFPGSEISTSDILKRVKQVAPEVSGDLQAFSKGTLTIEKANELRQGIDSATRSFYSREADPSFSKKVAVEFANVLRSAVQEGAPETAPFFAKVSREIPIHAALTKSPKFGLRTLIELGAGLTGHAPLTIGERIATSPTVQLNAAKALTKAAPLVEAGVKAATGATLVSTSRD